VHLFGWAPLPFSSAKSIGAPSQVRSLDWNPLIGALQPATAVFFRVVAYSSWGAQAAISGSGATWLRLFLYGLLACLGYATFSFVRLLFVRPSSVTRLASFEAHHLLGFMEALLEVARWKVIGQAFRTCALTSRVSLFGWA
jgi:hypothetical protein